MAAIDRITHASEYDDDRAEHERDLLAACRTARFTEAEQAEFLKAIDASDAALTPQWRFLLDRYWDCVGGA